MFMVTSFKIAAQVANDSNVRQQVRNPEQSVNNPDTRNKKQLPTLVNSRNVALAAFLLLS